MVVVLLACVILLRHEVEFGPRRDQFLLFHAVLEGADDAVRMLHHPPAHVALIDRLTLLRIFLQVRDAREAQRQFGRGSAAVA